MVALAGAGVLAAAALAAKIRVDAPPPPAAACERPAALDALAAGLSVVARTPTLRLIAALNAAHTLLVGILNVFVVVIGVQLLQLGGAGVGLVNAMLGVGGVAGGLVILAGLRGFTGNLRLGPLLCGLPLAGIGIYPAARTAGAGAGRCRLHAR